MPPKKPKNRTPRVTLEISRDITAKSAHPRVESNDSLNSSTVAKPPSRKRKLSLETAEESNQISRRVKRDVSKPDQRAAQLSDAQISTDGTGRAKVARSKGRTDRSAPLPVINKPPTKVLQIIVFGSGECGELGLGPREKEKPRAFVNPFLSGDEGTRFHIVQLDCGGMHTVALTDDNEIVTWGVNDRGALGRDTTWDGGLRDVDAESDDEDEQLNPMESTPTQIPADSFPPGARFVQVAAGDSCSFALTDTGLVYGWGTFLDAEGKPRFIYDSDALTEGLHKPSLIPGLEKITQVACGSNHAIALDQAGNVWAWGVGQKNQLGYRLFDSRHHNSRILEALQPRRVNLRRNKAKYIASGPDHSFAVDQNDNVWAWGLNRYGQAGYARDAGSDNVCLPYPMKIPDLCGRGVTVLSGGADHSVAVAAGGQCLAWGRIDGGQLGVELSHEQIQDHTLTRCDERGRPRICLRPVVVPNVGTVTYVGCGTGHTIFINEEGSAYGAGFGSLGQLGIASQDDATVATKITGAAVKGKKLVWCDAGGQFSMVAAPIETLSL
ncbi:regulator of chromosome condensation [Xylaria sp. FL0043]|nr:regulator of chromosome condensation [Xylaria sp. FL0043]